MGNSFTIKNKLQVLPNMTIIVPGCEPISSLTGLALSRNMKCNASVIPAKDALALIPGSRLVQVMRPTGTVDSGWFFELPEGPGRKPFDCPGHCVVDYYQILRDNSRNIELETEDGMPQGPCTGFDYSGCKREVDPQRRALDPDNSIYGRGPAISPAVPVI
jgi:hypothetical protein